MVRGMAAIAMCLLIGFAYFISTMTLLRYYLGGLEINLEFIVSAVYLSFINLVGLCYIFIGVFYTFCEKE